MTTWILRQMPGEVPMRKGPFQTSKLVEEFLRESYRLYPDAVHIVIAGVHNNDWYPQHGYEFLDMFGDRRRRHPRKDARQ